MKEGNVMKEGQRKTGKDAVADLKADTNAFKAEVKTAARDVKHDVKETAHEITDQAADTWRKEVGKLREDLDKLTESVTDGIRTTKGTAKNVYEDAREYATTAAVQAKDYVRENAVHAKEYAVDHGKELEQMIEAKVKERPLTAILVAAGIGLIAGAMLRR